MSVFYADSAGAQGTGDGSSASNATTAKLALNNNGANASSLHAALAAGDTIYIKGGTTVDFDDATYCTPQVAGTAAAPIRVIGYTTTVGDGGQFILNNTETGIIDYSGFVGITYWHYHNIVVTNARYGWGYASANADGCVFVNCVASGCASGGWDRLAGTGDSILFIGCRASNNTNVGFLQDHRSAIYINCVAIGNSTNGWDVDGNYSTAFINCAAIRNGAIGFDVNAGEFSMSHCVAHRNTGDGIYIGSTQPPVGMVNCGATSNGGYGINGVASTLVVAVNCGLNPTNETNTSGKNGSNVTLIEYGALTGDPAYTTTNPATATDTNLAIGSGSAWAATGWALGDSGYTTTPHLPDVGVSQRSASVGGSSVYRRLAKIIGG